MSTISCHSTDGEFDDQYEDFCMHCGIEMCDSMFWELHHELIEEEIVECPS
jgi:hypothetical protein